MFKIILASLLTFVALHASDYDRANQAAKESLKGLDCDFEDCPKEAPAPQVIIQERVIEKPAAIIQERIVEEPVAKVVHIERETPAATPTPKPVDRVYHSCQEIKEALPNARSGYMDIVIENKTYNVYCEMIIAGGGWTRVWRADQENYHQTKFDYDLPYSFVENSTYTMIAFENNNRLFQPFHFKTPKEWRVQHPMSYSRGVTTIDAIDDFTNIEHYARELFYGVENFSSGCSDSFKDGNWGKVCINETKAPFYAGFSHPYIDFCNDSTQMYNKVPCGEKRFVIYMK